MGPLPFETRSQVAQVGFKTTKKPRLILSFQLGFVLQVSAFPASTSSALGFEVQALCLVGFVQGWGPKASLRACCISISPTELHPQTSPPPPRTPPNTAFSEDRVLLGTPGWPLKLAIPDSATTVLGSRYTLPSPARNVCSHFFFLHLFT